MGIEGGEAIDAEQRRKKQRLQATQERRLAMINRAKSSSGCVCLCTSTAWVSLATTGQRSRVGRANGQTDARRQTPDGA